MSKKLLILNGLAILIVPLHHATAYGVQAMVFWVDRYRQVAVPNYDLVGTLPYELTVLIRQLNTFAVPAFLFISGFFLAFLARGEKSKVTWKSMMPRITTLLFPFVVWTIIRYILLRKLPTSLDDILDPYHFVPLLIQYYLLAPVLVPFAKRHPRILLFITSALLLFVQGLRYLSGMGVDFPGMSWILSLTPRWFILGQQPLWFPLGLVFGLNYQGFQSWLASQRRLLLPGTVMFGAFSFLEFHLIDSLNGDTWLNPVFGGFSRTLYILAFLLWFMSLDDRSIPFSEHITKVSARSLGIYMANIPFIYTVAVLMYKFTPTLLGIQPLYQSILYIFGLFGPLALMMLVMKSPARSVYRYVFG